MNLDSLDPAAPFRRIVENMNAPVLLFDAGLRLLYLNPAAEVLLEVSLRRGKGVTAQGLLGGSAAFMLQMQQALDSGHPFTEREVLLHLPHERALTVDCTATPLLEPHQPPALIVELTPLERQMRLAREEHLLTQHTLARDVIRGLAHEIKNPLGGLRGAAQLLERELPDPQLCEYTSIIIGEADRLQTLVNRLLGPNTVPHKRHVNVHELLERVRQLIRTEAGGAIQIQRDYDPSVPEVNADPDQLIQALLNLVRNAMQALGGEGEITLRTRVQRQVTLGQHRHKLVAVIEVIDNGPGIPPELLDKIFYPMVSGRPEGTGLGLSIAQSLIQRHGGLIECASEPGHTVFTLYLPLENAT